MLEIIIKYFWFIAFISTIISIGVLLTIRWFIKDIIKHMAQIQAGILMYFNGEDIEKARKEIAYGLAQDFGLCKEARQFLVDTCLCPAKECDKCKYWTCPGKQGKKIDI